MRTRAYIKNNGTTLCIIMSLLLFMFSLIVNTSTNNTDNVADKVGRRLEKRMKELDRYVGKALDTPHDRWIETDGLPEDMVIYRYVYDTLQSWANQFPVISDDINDRLIFHRLSYQRSNISSPLNNIGQTPKFISLGPKWYIVKSVSDGTGGRVIAGVEVQNTLFENLQRSENGVNRHLGLSSKFSIFPISYSGGSPVYFQGEPIFKVIYDMWQTAPFMANSLLRWFALLFLMIASVFYLLSHRTLKAYATNTAILVVVTAVAYLWGSMMQETAEIFSPTVYADGPFLYSFGALMLLNLAVFLFILCTFFVRDLFARRLIKAGRRQGYIIWGTMLALLFIGVAVYLHLTLKSLVMNSNISLELYTWHQINVYTIMVYISYTCLAFTLLLIGQMFMPVAHELTGIRYNLFSKKNIIVAALGCAIYFTAASAILGFRIEHNRVMVMTNRLAVDRDLGLEIRLKTIEEDIDNDPLISALASVDHSGNLIANRLTENYMTHIARTHDIRVSVCRASDVQCHKEFDRTINSGTPIEEGSSFVYIYDPNGESGYAGSFIYYTPKTGISRILIEISPKTYGSDRDYYSILRRYSSQDAAAIPAPYSYGKYVNGRLVSFKGDYAYPTKLDSRIKYNERGVYRINGYVHFTNLFSDEDVIIVSRHIKTPLTMFVTFSYLAIAFYMFLSLVTYRRKRKDSPIKRYYFRSRINAIILASLVVALIIFATFTVTFIYKQNAANINKTMVGKISTIQAMLDSKCRDAGSYRDINTPELDTILKDIARSTESGITLFTPEGKVFKSTTPDIFERMIAGPRINAAAYYNIVFRNQRYYIHSEKFGGRRFFSLYAPLFNSDGDMVAIISSPYSDYNYDFRQEAVFHIATIINLFFILLTITLMVSRSMADKMFRPLIEIGTRMKSTGVNETEYIMYKRNDEISVIVDAYNRMVHDLSESTKLLSQAERDKAWSEMARQVAHEIKNPLTPIKLEIQRLIRLKQKNDPSWGDKFDQVSSIVLEHIDILTDTANEFSTFAKLYSEAPVVMDIDKALRDQVTIFDNRDNITIDYFGLTGATVLAPKPQLIRVFVNLITNAVQAIEIMQKEEEAKGEETRNGRVYISLRYSTKEGFYDIVFEDTGTGVKDENKDKLFTPNFTTKSGGTGLGLAICRNIVEKCEGEILYQRSQMLKGACFIVRLPRYTE